MKYLKLYEAFNYEDIKDILLEVEDLGYKAILQGDQIATSDFFYIKIFKYAPENVKFEEVKDCLLRLKEYAGNRFINFMVYVTTTIGWRTIELCEDTELDYNIDMCVLKIYKTI